MWGWVLRRFGADGGETPGVELGVHVGPSGFAPAPSPGRATNASRLSWDLGAGGRRGRPSVRPASRAREPVEGKAGCGLRAWGPHLPLTLRVRVKETPSAAPTPRSPPGPDAWAPVPRPLEESRSHRLPPWGTTWDSRLREPETETPATLPTRRRRLQPVSPARPEKPRLRDTVSAQESEAKPGKIQRPTPRAPTPRSRGRRGLAPHFAGPERPLAPGAGSSSRAVRGPRAVLHFRLEGQVTWDR